MPISCYFPFVQHSLLLRAVTVSNLGITFQTRGDMGSSLPHISLRQAINSLLIKSQYYPTGFTTNKGNKAFHNTNRWQCCSAF